MGKPIFQLPTEILTIVLGLLEQRDWAHLQIVNRFFHAFVNRMQSGAPFIVTINREIQKTGYKVPAFFSAVTRGIDSYPQQTNFLTMIRQHHEIREQRTLFKLLALQGQASSEQVAKINGSINKIEALFGLSSHEIKLDKAQVEEQKIKKIRAFLMSAGQQQTKTTAPIYNPILLRIYIEMLRMLTLANKPNKDNLLLYKKLLSAALLLLKLDSSEVYFCLADILTKLFVQMKTETLTEIQIALNAITIETDNSYISFLKQAFAKNGIDFPSAANTQNSERLIPSFLQQFNYTLAFFFPAKMTTFIKKLIASYGLNALILVNHTPLSLFRCLFSEYETIIYKKIFTRAAKSNLTEYKKRFYKDQKYDEDQEQPYSIIVTLARHQSLFEHLSLILILNFPLCLLSIMNSIEKIADVKAWREEYISDLANNVTKLSAIAPVLEYWQGEDIKTILTRDNSEFFHLISECPHQKLLFSRFNLQDLDELYANTAEEQSLLALYCEKDNLLIIKAMQAMDTVNKLASNVTQNPAISTLLRTKNASLLISNFPGYYHGLRNNSIIMDQRLESLLELLKDKELFLLVMQLCKKQVELVEENQDLIRLLRNPLVFLYVQKWQLTFDDMRNEQLLFSHLSLNGKESSHIYLLSVDLKTLSQLLQSEILLLLLSIRSETLFAWALFGIVTRPHAYTQNIAHLQIRSLEEIQIVFNGSLTEHLDSFGYTLSNDSKDFKHCDYVILEAFSLQELEHLEIAHITPEHSYLKKMCSLNPTILKFALSQSTQRNKINIDKFVAVMQLTIWDLLASSSSGFLCAVYFNLNYILYLSSTTFGQTSLLEALLLEDKNLFKKLICNCTQTTLLQEQDYFKTQPIPTVYKLDIDAFDKAFKEHLLSYCKYFSIKSETKKRPLVSLPSSCVVKKEKKSSAEKDSFVTSKML